MNISKENIDILQNYFKDKPVFKAFIFGSFARGEANSKSDYDILVELDYSKKIGMEFIQMQIDLVDLLQTNVDLVSEKALSIYIRPFVDKDKILIYERKNRR
jgi:predicted nucleotidyltransferase